LTSTEPGRWATAPDLDDLPGDEPAGGADDLPVLDDGPIVADGTTRRPGRGRFVVLGLACVAALGFLLWKGLTDSAVYYRTVTESVERLEAGEAERFRMAGDVVDGSVDPTDGGVEFRITDGTTVARVSHRGDPPELFDSGVPVVVEGRWDGDVFRSDRILIRHDNEYDPGENGYEPAGPTADGVVGDAPGEGGG
jgi:cytochrome c-type biogenesis protein CcmE